MINQQLKNNFINRFSGEPRICFKQGLPQEESLMKIQLRGNWNAISMLRLIAGMAGSIQCFVINELALSLAGFFLVYMAIAVGDTVEVKLEEAKTTKEKEYEKVDARL